MVKFANNDRSRLCCSSKDQTLSICDVSNSSQVVLAILKGHTDAVTGKSLENNMKTYTIHNSLPLKLIKMLAVE